TRSLQRHPSTLYKFQENGYDEGGNEGDLGDSQDLRTWRRFPCQLHGRPHPTSRAHSESIVALFDKPVDVAAARKTLEEAPGVKLVDNPDKLEYPMPLTATGQYDIEVGRLRENIAFDNALEFFVCGDQLLRGAALNAVIVAEAMLDNGALVGSS
ncbi:hypothetical protein THAOC_12945, partial [Thalassiosira oceanica]